MGALNNNLKNPFFHKIMFESVNDTKAIKELMIKQVTGKDNPEISKVRTVKNEEIKGLESQLDELKFEAENLNVQIDNFEEGTLLSEK